MALATMLVACFGQTDTTVCADGTRCPTGLVCAEAFGACVTEDRVRACESFDEGDQCTFGGRRGICTSGVCASGCGDAIIDRSAGEDCEGTDFAGESCISAGFYGGQLGCSSDCTLSLDDCWGVCGDGVRNGPENCDGEDGLSACLALGYDRGEPSCSMDCLRGAEECFTIGFSPFPGAPVGETTAAAGQRLEHLFAGSADGLVFRYDGWSWQQTFSTASAVTDLYVVSDEVVVGLTDDRLLRLAGGQWSEEALPQGTSSPTGVWASSANDVYVVTFDGRALRFDGTSWTEFSPSMDPSFRVRDVWGRHANDVWLGGGVEEAAGSLYHFDGSSWNLVVADAPGEILDVDGNQESLYVVVALRVGFGSVSLFVDGALVPLPEPPWGFSGISVTDTMVTGFSGVAGSFMLREEGWEHVGFPPVWGEYRHVAVEKAIMGINHGAPLVLYQGTSKTRTPLDFLVTAMWAHDDQIYMGGQGGRIERTDAEPLQQGAALCDFNGSQPALPTCPTGTVGALWGWDADDILVATSDALSAQLYRFQGGVFTPVASLATAAQSMSGVSERVFVVGHRYLGTYFEDAFASDSVTDSIHGVWALSDSEAIAVGSALWFYQAGAWMSGPALPEGYGTSVWASSVDDIWVSSRNPIAYHHHDGLQWTSYSASDVGYVAGFAADDVFLGGEYHFDGEVARSIRLRGVQTIGQMAAGQNALYVHSFESSAWGSVGNFAILRIRRQQPW
jgi:hypothetical protein